MSVSPHSFFENVVAQDPAPGAQREVPDAGTCTHLTGADHVASLTAALGSLNGQLDVLDEWGRLLAGVLTGEGRGRLLAAGNGGSAAQAQHLTAELVGRYRADRPPFSAICLTAESRAVREERKGPRTDAPEKAIEGFLRGAGLSSIDEAEVRSDGRKGEFYVAVIQKPGRPAEEIVAEVMPGIIRDFPWPKSMRWGPASREAGSLRWVRPLHSIIATFGPETEEPEIVKFEVGGIASGDVTHGHRFLAPDAIKVKRFDDYIQSLERAKVVLAMLEAEDRATPRGFEDLPLFAAQAKPAAPDPRQSALEALVGALQAINPDDMSPREALEALYALKQKSQDRA